MLWCKVGIFSGGNFPKNLTCNIIRNSESTCVRETQPGMKGAVTGLMTHSETTADKHYYITGKINKASVAGNAIRKYFKADEQLSKSPSRHKWTSDEITKVNKVWKFS